MDIFDLVATLSLDSSKYEQGLDGAETTASKKGVNIGNALGKVGKIAGVALTTAVAGVSALTTASTKAYAEFEQLVGGVETLFGSKYSNVEEYAKGIGLSVEEASKSFDQYQERAKTVLDNANNAYKTAGLSAIEYMNTVTSFSASLNASLGENAWQSANYADMAITDMADNANKMGTSMEAIQNAYQGFAKQNYTMLDNLKLGYGGTKEEMERLLRDAEELEGYKLGSLDVSNFSDIIDAIHIVQENLGIAGATQQEAMSTISGSLNMMKSAWKNVITGIADENADFGAQIDALATSATAFAENIVPRIGVALKGIGTLVQKIAPVLAEELPKLLNELAPTLIQSAMSLLDSLISAIPSFVPIILDVAQTLISQLGSKLPTLVKTLGSVVVELIKGLTKIIPTILPEILRAILDTIKALIGELPTILSALMDFMDVLVNTLLTEVLPMLIDALPDIITGVIDFIMKSSTQITNAVVGIITAVVQNFPTILKKLIDALPSLITGVITAILSNLPAFIEAGIQLFIGLITGIPTIIVELVKAIPDIVRAIIQGFKDAKPQMEEAGKELLAMFMGGFNTVSVPVSEFFGNIIEAIKGFFVSIGEKVEEFFRPAVEKILAIWAWFDETFSPIINAFKELFATIFQAIQIIAERAWSAITETIRQAWDAIWEKISPVIEKIKELIKTGFEFVYNKVKEPLDKIKENVRIGFEYVYSKIKEPLEKAKNTVSDTLEKIKGIFQGLIDKAKTWGIDMIQNFIDGIKAKLSALTDTIKNITQTIKDYVGFSEPKKGALSNFHTYAPDMMDLFIKGINDNKAHLQDAVAGAFDFRDMIVGQDMQASGNGGKDSSNKIGANYYTINVNQPVSTPADMLREIRTEAQYGLMIGESLA